jgi:hypothetical protein
MQAAEKSSELATTKNENKSPDGESLKIGWLATGAAVGAAVIAASVLMVIIYSLTLKEQANGTVELVLKHLPAVVGVPASAACAFIVVVLLRQSQGPIYFEGLGFKFSGASGPVVLWVLCFLAFVAATRLLWDAAG